jgi:HD-like signal output (HDOD) protein
MPAIASSTIPAMGPRKKDAQALISGAIDSISHIATLPEITFKIIEMVENPRSTAQDLCKLISSDPALAARILKVVNSSFYGMSGQIASINHAVVLLGLNVVKNIVIAASLTKLFHGGRGSPYFSGKDLWTHSIAVGVFSRLMVTRLRNALPEEALLAGLIHDIGIVVELQEFHKALFEIAQRATRESVRHIDLETQIIGVDHQALGAGLTARWRFPHCFQYVTGYHHNPMALGPECRALTMVIHVADHICVREGLGYCLTCKEEPLDPGVLAELNLRMETLNEWAKALPEALRETETMLL